MLGKPQLPYEHVVIPKGAQSHELRNLVGSVKTSQLWRNANVGGMEFYEWLTRPTLGSLVINGVYWGSAVAAASGPFIFKANKRIGAHLSKTGTVNAPFDAAYENAGGGYKRIEPGRLNAQLSRMTHGVIDNADNIVLLRHPLHGVAKAQNFKERAKHLGIWLKWNQRLQRQSFRVR
ncbi:MAG: hypothetical protein WC792_06370 [Candidatus Micrarchaeia archaeon]